MLLLWDTQTRKCQRVLQAGGRGGSVQSIVFSSNGLYVAAAIDTFIMVWDLGTGSQLRTFVGHEDKVVLVAFASDDRHIQSASTDATVRMWDMANSSCLRTVRIPIWKEGSVAFSSDQTKVASISHVHVSIHLWDSASGCILGTLEHTGTEYVAFSPDDTMLMSAAATTIKLWDLTDDMESISMWLSQGDPFIFLMAFSSDGNQLAVLSASSLQVLDANTGQCLRKLEEWKASWGGASVTFDNGDILLARTSEGNRDVAEVWNVCTRTCLQAL